MLLEDKFLRCVYISLHSDALHPATTAVQTASIIVSLIVGMC
jgi:hypothetical protein